MRNVKLTVAQMVNSVARSTFILMHHHHYPFSEPFHLPEQKQCPRYTLRLSLHPLATTTLPSVSMNVTTLET